MRWLRELAGISARELDRLVGKTRCCHAATIETRLHDRVQLNTIGAYADALGVSVDWLRTGTGDAPTADDLRASIEARRALQLAAVA